MTDTFNACLEELGRVAREKAVAEESFRKEIARRTQELKTERVFAYRRLNLLKAVAAELSSAESEEDALASGRHVLFREAGWGGGANPSRDEVFEHFAPVVLAIWQANKPADEDSAPAEGDGIDIGEALEAFESWYAETHQSAFLHLMEREIVEMPLVEV